MKNLINTTKGVSAAINFNRFVTNKRTNLISRASVYIGLVCLGSLTVYSCNKDHSHPLPATASLMIIQGAESAPQDGITLDKKQISAPTNPLKYGGYTDYSDTFFGGHVVTVAEYGPGSQTDVTATNDTLFLNPNNNYSLFLSSVYGGANINNVSTNNDQPIGLAAILKTKFTLLIDSLSQPATGQAKIRFVNVSANAGPVDLVMDGNVLVSNKSTGGYSMFAPVNSTTSSNFEVRVNGGSTVLGTLKNIQIKSGGIYTIWLYGVASDTQGTGLNLGLIINKQY